MTNEEIQLIKEIKQGNLEASYDLLTVNHSFLVNLYRKLHVYGYYYEEFEMICYEALIKAANHADLTKGYCFNAYWKKYILHEYLLEKIQLQYAFSLTTAEYSTAKRDNVDLINNYYRRSTSKQEGLIINDVYECVFQAELRKLVWIEVSKTVTNENAYILWELFSKNRTLTSLAQELHIGTDRVRMRKIRSLKKLKENKKLRELAYDYYGILC
jgi:hypothetical protein